MLSGGERSSVLDKKVGENTWGEESAVSCFYAGFAMHKKGTRPIQGNPPRIKREKKWRQEKRIGSRREKRK